MLSLSLNVMFEGDDEVHVTIDTTVNSSALFYIYCILISNCNKRKNRKHNACYSSSFYSACKFS